MSLSPSVPSPQPLPHLQPHLEPTQENVLPSDSPAQENPLQNNESSKAQEQESLENEQEKETTNNDSNFQQNPTEENKINIVEQSNNNTIPQNKENPNSDNVSQQPPKQSQPKITSLPQEPTAKLPQISTKTLSNILSSATQIKNQGNKYFKNKMYVEAIAEYSKALTALEPNLFYAATMQERSKLMQLSSSLMYNLGCCFFNSYDMVKSQLYLNEAITINPKYIKALHKRALARYELKKYDQAFADIKNAWNLDSSNVQIHASYSKILEKYNQEMKIAKEKAKELSAKMFNASQVKKEEEKKEQAKKEWNWVKTLGAVSTLTLIGLGAYKVLFRK